MTHNIVLAVVGLFAIAGCNAAPKDIYTADGRKGHALNCNPNDTVARRVEVATASQGVHPHTPPPVQVNWNNCLAQAGNICGARGYDVLDRQPSGTMVVQCKGQ